VLVDGNVFEHNWPQAQNGFAILFTVRNQDGHAPWSVVKDVAVLSACSSPSALFGFDDFQLDLTILRPDLTIFAWI
jgi:hypothetical protein